MKLYDLCKALDLEDMILEYCDDVNFDREVVVMTDRQLLPNASYDFEVETDREVLELHVQGRMEARKGAEEYNEPGSVE